MRPIEVKRYLPEQSVLSIIGGTIRMGGEIIPDEKGVEPKFKVRGIGLKAICRCPKCDGEFDVKYCKNIKKIFGKCNCGFKYFEDQDLVQPSSPFFEIIYGTDLVDGLKTTERKNNLYKLNWQNEREKRIWEKQKQGLLKSHELEDIKKYVKERGLE